MASEEEERHLKQNFLRSEIIDQGFDAGEFSEYIGKKKENGRNELKKAQISTTGLMMSSSE